MCSTLIRYLYTRLKLGLKFLSLLPVKHRTVNNLHRLLLFVFRKLFLFNLFRFFLLLNLLYSRYTFEGIYLSFLFQDSFRYFFFQIICSYWIYLCWFTATNTAVTFIRTEPMKTMKVENIINEIIKLYLGVSNQKPLKQNAF